MSAALPDSLLRAIRRAEADAANARALQSALDNAPRMEPVNCRSTLSNVRWIGFTLRSLGHVVFNSDRMHAPASRELLIERVLDVVFKERIARLATGGTTVRVDLGDGTVLACQVQPKEPS